MAKVSNIPKILVLLILAVIFIQNVQAYPINVTDDYGYNVTINSSNSIVSLAPSNTEILFAVGAGSRVVGVTTYADYPPEAQNISKIGGGTTVNNEAVVNLTPDLVLAYEKGDVNTLRNLSLTVVALNPKNLDDIINDILLVGNITGNDANASTIAKNMKQDIKNITDVTNNLSENQKPRVLYIVWDSPIYAAGNGTYADDIIKKAGGINIAKSSGWPVMSPESIVAENPQIIITSGMGTGGEAMRDRILNNTGFATTDAVRANRVYAISDPNIIERPGPRITEGLQEFYKYFSRYTYTLTHITVSNINTTTHIVNVTINISSPDRKFIVTIPSGTNASINGLAITNVTINPLAQLNNTFVTNLVSSDTLIGENLSLGPAGATFSPDIQIRMNYTSAMLTAAGISASELRIKFYNLSTHQWVAQTPYTLNETGKYITANVSHFSTFALIGTATTATATTTTSNIGSGGSGGGVTTSEPYANIAKAEQREKDLLANKPVTYTYTSPELGVYAIVVIDKDNEYDISLRVEDLKNTSKLVSASPSGTVYKNVNIWTGTKRIKSALIRFNVNNSWLNSNNIASVKLVRWENGKWVQLDTTRGTKGTKYTSYEAKTTGFSSFAIIGLKKGGVVATAKATPTIISTPTTPGKTSTQTETPKSTPISPGFESILAIVSILLAVHLRKL